jgi:hypothetical protein
MMDINKLRELASKATPGRWKVYETRYAYKSPRHGNIGHVEGEHVERNICTEWTHPQLKGPVPVVGVSSGIGNVDTGVKGYTFTHIEAKDAAYIAAASPDVLLALLDVAEKARTLLDANQAFLQASTRSALRSEAIPPEVTVEAALADAALRTSLDVIRKLGAQE